MNPYSAPMMQSYHTYRALHGLDPSCIGYISYTETLPAASAQTAAPAAAPAEKAAADAGVSELQNAVIRGLRDRAGVLTAEALAGGADALVLVQDQKGWFHTLEDFSHASITLEPCIGYLNDPEEDYYQYDYSLDF
jgi:hypothetical protein